MSIQEALEKIHAGNQEITEYFGTTCCPLEDHTDKYWYYPKNGDINYDDEPFEEDEQNYSHEVVRNRVIEKADYTLAYIDDGCGERFYMLLDNSKRLKFDG